VRCVVRPAAVGMCATCKLQAPVVRLPHAPMAGFCRECVTDLVCLWAKDRRVELKEIGVSPVVDGGE
jgi:hypothetical protein